MIKDIKISFENETIIQLSNLSWNNVDIQVEILDPYKRKPGTFDYNSLKQLKRIIEFTQNEMTLLMNEERDKPQNKYQGL